MMPSYVDFGADRTPVTSDPARPEAAVDRPVGAEMDDRGDGGRRGVLGRVIGVAALVVGLQVLLVALFAWPAIKTAPRDLPVVVAAPPPAAAALAQRLAAARPGAFDVTTVADETAAGTALRDREAYAAFVLRPRGPALLVASGASPVVAQLLTQQAQALGGGSSVQVIDVVPTDRDDPRGAGFAAGFLPLVLTSLAAGVLMLAAVRSWRVRLTGIIVFAVGAGFAGAAVLQYWLGVLPGSYPLNAAVIGLLALAISGAVAGLGALLGPPGVGLAALAVFVVGNPLSAVASAPELLPQPWGAVGQFLPPGAGATLLRSTAYFDGAGGAIAAWTLAAWAVGGIVLLMIGRRRIRAH
jgi:hypothetical protein